MSEVAWFRVGPRGRLAQWIYPLVRNMAWFPALTDQIFDRRHVPWMIRHFVFDLGNGVTNWQKLLQMTPDQRVLWFAARQDDIGVIDAEYFDWDSPPPQPPALQHQLTNGNDRQL